LDSVSQETEMAENLEVGTNVEGKKMEEEKSTDKNCLQKYWKGVLLIVVLGGLGLMASTVFQEEIIEGIKWFNENGTKGAIIYAFFFVVVLIVGVPATILELGAAVIFEDIWVTIVVCTIAKNTGNIIMFFIGLKFLRGWVEKNMLTPENVFMRALARVIVQKPYRYAVMWGFAYVPIWTKNYGLPVFGCPLLAFVVAGNITGIPYTILWALIGNTARDAILSNGEESDDTLDTSQLIITIVGIVVLFVSISVVGYYARKAMNELKEEEEQLEKDNPESIIELVEQIESQHASL